MSDQDLREHWQKLQRAGHTIADVFRRAVADGADPAQLLVDACRTTPERFLHVEARTVIDGLPPPAVCQLDSEGKVPTSRPLVILRTVSQFDVSRQPPDSPPVCFACMYMLARFMQQTNARRLEHLERLRRDAAGMGAWTSIDDAVDACGACGHAWDEHEPEHGCRHVTEGAAHPGTCMCSRWRNPSQRPRAAEDRFVRPGFHVGAVTTLPDDTPEHDDDQGP